MRREKRGQQIKGPSRQLRPALDRYREGPAPGDLLKILKLHFQRHGSTSDLCLLAVGPDLVDDGLQLCTGFGQRPYVLRERILGSDRLTNAIGSHRAIINAPGYPVVVAPRFSEALFQEGPRLRLEVCARVDAKPVHFRGGRWPDAVEFSDGQRLHEGRPHLRGDHEHAVRFALVGGELRQEFVVGYARRGGEARVSSYLDPDLLRNLRCERDAL